MLVFEINEYIMSTNILICKHNLFFRNVLNFYFLPISEGIFFRSLLIHQGQWIKIIWLTRTGTERVQPAPSPIPNVHISSTFLWRAFIRIQPLFEICPFHINSVPFQNPAVLLTVSISLMFWHFFCRQATIGIIRG